MRQIQYYLGRNGVANPDTHAAAVFGMTSQDDIADYLEHTAHCAAADADRHATAIMRLMAVAPAGAAGHSTTAHSGVVASAVPPFAGVEPSSRVERWAKRFLVAAGMIIVALMMFIIMSPGKGKAKTTLPPVAALPACAVEFSLCQSKAAPLIVAGLRAQVDADSVCRAQWDPATGNCK